MDTPRSKRHRSLDCRGFGLIELMATVAIVSILAAMGLTSFDRTRTDINSSLRQVSADVRWARARAIVSGDHMRFRVTGDNTYAIDRLTEVDGVWETSATLRETELPSHIELSTGERDFIDIDSRGTVVFDDASETAPFTWTLNDSKFATTRTVTVYPSGQVDADA